jgi:hypothetical protein
MPRRKPSTLTTEMADRLRELLDFANCYEDPWHAGFSAPPILAGQSRIHLRDCCDAVTAARAAIRSQVAALHDRRPIDLPTFPAYSAGMLNELSGKEATELSALLRAFDEVLAALAAHGTVRIDACEHCGQFFAIRKTAGRPGIYCMPECRCDDRPQRYQRKRDQLVEKARELRRLKKSVDLK